MVKKTKEEKKIEEDQEMIEGDYLDNPEEPVEEVEDDIEEDEGQGVGPSPEETLINILTQRFDILVSRMDKIQNAVALNQKYLTEHHKEIAKLKEDFKLLLEEK